MQTAVEPRPGIGAFVHLSRERSGVSQRQLCKAIRRSPTYLSKFEKGLIEEPSFRAFSQIVVALGLSPWEVWTLCRVALDGEDIVTEAWASERSPQP